MSSETGTISVLLDPEKWPSIGRPEFLEELNTLADSLYGKQTLEGLVASLLIYHQIAEEMIKALIRVSIFVVKCEHLEFDIQDRNLEDMMFGQLLKELNHSLKIQGTDQLISKCQELNKQRIKIAHKITKKPNIEEIKLVCKNSKQKFDQIFKLYDNIYDQWRLYLKDIKKGYEADHDL